MGGVSMVSCAGYDSIPPDLTTYLAAKALAQEGEHLQRFEAFVGSSGGALPTGTLNTVLNGVRDGKQRALGAATFGLLGTKAAIPKGDANKDSHPSTDSLLVKKPRSKFVPPAEQGNLKKNLFWTMCPGYSQLAGQFCLPHFMAPINVHAVHYTAAKEGYGGLEYRERIGGLPRGVLSLFGLLPMLFGLSGTILVLLLLLFPGASAMALKLRIGSILLCSRTCGTACSIVSCRRVRPMFMVMGYHREAEGSMSKCRANMTQV